MKMSNLTKSDLYLISIALGIYLEINLESGVPSPEMVRVLELQRAFAKASDGVEQ